MVPKERRNSDLSDLALICTMHSSSGMYMWESWQTVTLYFIIRWRLENKKLHAVQKYSVGSNSCLHVDPYCVLLWMSLLKCKEVFSSFPVSEHLQWLHRYQVHVKRAHIYSMCLNFANNVLFSYDKHLCPTATIKSIFTKSFFNKNSSYSHGLNLTKFTTESQKHFGYSNAHKSKR